MPTTITTKELTMRTDHAENREPLPPHRQEPFRHRPGRDRVSHHGSRPTGWLRSEDGPRLVSPQPRFAASVIGSGSTPPLQASPAPAATHPL